MSERTIAWLDRASNPTLTRCDSCDLQVPAESLTFCERCRRFLCEICFGDLAEDFCLLCLIEKEQAHGLRSV